MDCKNSARNYDMAKNYKQFKLLDVATISGSRVSQFDGVKKYIATADIDFNKIVSGEDVTYLDRPSRADLVMTKDDVLFAKMKSTKKVLAGTPEVEDLVFSTGFYILKPNKNINKKYLYFYLLSDEFNHQKDMYCSGATMAALGNSGLNKILISIPVDNFGNPDVKEQERVAYLLEEAEILKQKRAEADQKMEEVIPALFSKMFGDPQDDSKSPLSSLGEYINVKHGFAFKSEYFTNEKNRYVLLTPGNFYETGGYKDQGKKQKFYTGPIPEGYVLEKGALLVAMTEQSPGLLVSPILVPESGKFLHNQRLGLIKFSEERVNRYYLYCLFNHAKIRRIISNSATGTKVQHTSPAKIEEIKVSIPPISLQNEFAERVKEILLLKEKQNRSSESINQLFASLLSKSLTT